MSRRVVRRVASVVAGGAYVATYAVELAPWPPHWLPPWVARLGMPPGTPGEPSCGPEPGSDVVTDGPGGPERSTAVASGTGQRGEEAA